MTRLTLLIIFLCSCSSVPESFKPVKNFELDRYLGVWYEVARLDHSFERHMKQVTAEYSLRSDGGVKVVNKGYHLKKKKWKEAEGKAYFATDNHTGHLKVSFFGPFYGDYIILELEQENYSYALVAGPDYDYLWILSRTPVLKQDIVDKLITKANKIGFATEDLIYVEHYNFGIDG